MMMATTDTIPQQYSVLGVVMAGGTGLTPAKALWSTGSQKKTITDHAQNALRDLEREAVRIGADAVIGIRYTSIYGNNSVMMGTAVRFEYANATPTGSR